MHICAYVIMYFVFLDKCIKWRIVNKFFRGDRMKLLEHEKRFQNMELSPRFHAVSMEICRDYQRAFMRALSVATLLMDLGANESEIVLGMVCATGAWRSVEIKLSEAKAAGRIRLFLGVLEEDPEYDQFVLEDSLLTSTDGISHKMGRRFLRRGTCTFSSSGTAIYGVSLIHNQLGLDALVDCFKN